MAFNLDLSRPIYKKPAVVITQDDIDALRGELASMEPPAPPDVVPDYVPPEPPAPPLTPEEASGAQTDLEAGGALEATGSLRPSLLPGDYLPGQHARATGNYAGLPRQPEPRYSVGGIPDLPHATGGIPEYLGAPEPSIFAPQGPFPLNIPGVKGAAEGLINAATTPTYPERPDYNPVRDVPVIGGVENVLEKWQGLNPSLTAQGYNPNEGPLDILAHAGIVGAGPGGLLPTVLKTETPGILKVGAGVLGQEVRDFGGAAARGAEAVGKQAGDVLGSERGSLGLGGEATNASEELAGAGKAANALPDSGMAASEARPPAPSKTVAETIAEALPDKPNAARGEVAIRKVEAAGFDTGDARTALDDYRGIERPDYEDVESYRDDRQDAWEAFRDTLAQSEERERKAAENLLTARPETSPGALQSSMGTVEEASRGSLSEGQRAPLASLEGLGAQQARREAAEGPFPRAFGESLQESEAIGPELKGVLTENPLTYAERRNTAAGFEAAQQRVAANPDEAMTNLLTAAKLSDREVFDAQALIVKYQQEGMAHQAAGRTLEAEAAFGKEAAAAKKAVEGLTEAGRAVQAASVIDLLSPVSTRIYAERVIQTAAARSGDKAVINRIAQQAEKVQRDAIMESTNKDLQWLQDVRAASQRIEKSIQDVVYAPPKQYAAKNVDWKDFRTALSAIMGDEAGAVRLGGKAGSLTQETAKALYEEAQRVKTLTGEEQKLARAALESKLNALEQSADSVQRPPRVRKAVEAWNNRAAKLDALKEARQQEQAADEIWKANEQVAAAHKKEAAAQVQADRVATRARTAESVREQARAQQALNVARDEARRAERAADSVWQANQKVVGARERAQAAAFLKESRGKARQAELELQKAETALRAQQAKITYLTDAEARVIQKRTVEDYDKTIALLRATVRKNDLELPRALAESFYQRSQAMKALPLDSPDRYRMAQDLFADIANLAPPNKWDAAMDVLNIPRTVKTMWDFSAPFRQGAVLAAGHPVIFAKEFVPMFRAALDAGYARDLDAALHVRPGAKLGEQAGLYLAPPGGRLYGREEAYASTITHWIPGAKWSERAYVTFLNKLRADVFDSVVRSWEKEGIQATPKDLHDWAQFVNWATGRGSLPAGVDRAAPALSAVFFSPRFAVSRAELAFAGLKAGASLVPGAQRVAPGMLYSPLVARQIGRDLAAFVGGGLTILGLAKMGGAEVEIDPRSSDFGRIKVGNTRWDVWAGEQQLARYAVQLVTGQRKTSTGKIEEIKRNGVVGNWLRSKLSPQAGLLSDVLQGERYGGGEMYGPIAGETAFRDLPPNVQQYLKAKGWDDRAKPFVTAVELGWNELAPLALADTLDAFTQNGMTVTPQLPAAALATTFGVGVQSYQTIASLRDTAAGGLEPGKRYAELDNAEKRKVDDSPEVQNAFEQYALGQHLDPKLEAQAAQDLYDKRVALAVNGFEGTVPYLKNDKARAAYIKEFKDTVYKAAQDTIAQPSVLASRGPKEYTIRKDALGAAYWAAPLPIDLDTGEPDYRARDKTRQDIVDQAQQEGIDPAYFTQRGPENFLDKAFADEPEIRKWLDPYEQAQETLRPYWELRDQVKKTYHAVLDPLQAQAERARSNGNEPLARAYEQQAKNTLQEVLKGPRTYYRLHHKDVDKALQQWYGLAPLVAK